MMRPHCDRCDKLCDEYPSWVEDTVTKPEDTTHPLWHINIDAGGDTRYRGEKMFCRACRIAVLEAHVKGLKEKS